MTLTVVHLNSNIVTIKEDIMMRGRPTVVGRNRVYIRVLLSREDYRVIKQIADDERTDVSSLVRRAIARCFLAPKGNDVNK